MNRGPREQGGGYCKLNFFSRREGVHLFQKTCVRLDIFSRGGVSAVTYTYNFFGQPYVCDISGRCREMLQKSLLKKKLKKKGIRAACVPDLSDKIKYVQLLQ